MDFRSAIDDYWKYYISLEKQFIETERYVEFDYINNGKTYSMEYMKLFQAVCSEIDVVGKKVAQLLDDSFIVKKTTGINEWWYYITKSYPEMKDRKCSLLRKRELEPWKNYDVVENPKEKRKKYILNCTCTPKGKTPFWWNDYNSVKHNRTGKNEMNSTNFTKANLQNLFYSFAALYSLDVLLMSIAYSEQDETISVELESRLFIEELPFYTQLLCVR